MHVIQYALKKMVAPAWFRLACCCVLIGIAFILCFQRTLAIQTVVPVSVFNAIPPAISSVVFGHNKKYTSLVAVNEMYRSALGDHATDERAINNTILRIAKSDLPAQNNDYQLLGVDDKGIVDFVSVAFRLFGLNIQSTVYLYFLVLLVSAGFFILSFYRHRSCLFLLTSFLVAFYLMLPSIVFNAQLNSILSFRAMPILAMIACLHCILYALLLPRERHQILLLVMQVCILIFVVHMRTTTIGQILTISAVSIIAFVYHNWHKAHRQQPSLLRSRLIFSPLWPLLLVVIAYFGLQGYRTWAFPDEYQRGEQIMTRTIWHNVFSGLALHPQFEENYNLRIDDNSVVQAAGEYLVEKGRAQEWERVGISAPNFSVTHWAAYDKVVREMLVDRCIEYFSACLTTTLYYKPLSLGRTLAWLYGMRSSLPDLDIFVSRYWGDAVKVQMLEMGHQLDAQKSRAYPWTPLAVLLLLPFIILLLGEDRRGRGIALAGGVALAVGSTLPSLIGYPAPFVVADTAIAVLMLIYLSFFFALTPLLDHWLIKSQIRNATIESGT